MNFLNSLAASNAVAHAILVLSLVAVSGMALGNLKVKGIGLGGAGVMFAGILFAHFGVRVDGEILHFVRELGLILFVYTIGMQVGPGFFASLRKHGLSINALAATIVVTGSLLAVLLAKLTGIDMAAMLGVLTGATTNTPSLGAVQEALKTLPGMTDARQQLPGIGYAVAYPAGILGLIVTMLAVRAFFRVKVDEENDAWQKEQAAGQVAPARMTLVVENVNLAGIKLADVPGLDGLKVSVSRHKSAAGGPVMAAHEDTVLQLGDRIVAVGAPKDLAGFRVIVGRESPEDLTTAPGTVTFRRVVVTRKAVLGKTLAMLSLRQRFGVTITRVTRADIELSADPKLHLAFGDKVQIVGNADDLDRASAELGNSGKELNQTNFIAMFAGIALGVLVGLYPINAFDMPTPIRLGLAGGPLLFALVISRIGRIGPVVWHMPENANHAFREFGITLFLACVGLKAGSGFFEHLLTSTGALLFACAIVITMVPLALAGWIGRVWLKMKFGPLCGLLAGSLTDPPALAYAQSMNQSNAPTLAYATVYPLTMLLRIVLAQVLALLFCR
jgi:putative transport protein